MSLPMAPRIFRCPSLHPAADRTLLRYRCSRLASRSCALWNIQSAAVPENLILDSNWSYYQSPAGVKLRILSTTPPAAQLVRVAWTARHADDCSTVPLQDFEAVTDFAASLCAEALAATYAQTRDNTVGADTVNYRTKGQEYLTLAKALRQRYYNALGVEDGGGAKGGGTEQKPAIAIGDMDNIMQGGVDRLIHSKFTR
jgi:hypothetical protein